MLLKFDGTATRGPSASLCAGTVDWPKGSAQAQVSQADFDDHVPYHAALYTTDPGTSEVTLETTRFGVIDVFEAAGSNETAGVQRLNSYILSAVPLTIFGARVKQVADADSPQMFIGLFDGAVTAVFSAGALAVSSNQDMLGLRWNADETIDIVANVDGTLTVLKDDIGVTVERTSGFNEMGLRVENHGGESYRLTPVINGQRRNGVTVDDSAIPESVAMKFTLSSTVAATTNVNFEVDWIYTNDK